MGVLGEKPEKRYDIPDRRNAFGNRCCCFAVFLLTERGSRKHRIFWILKRWKPWFSRTLWFSRTQSLWPQVKLCQTPFTDELMSRLCKPFENKNWRYYWLLEPCVICLTTCMEADSSAQSSSCLCSPPLLTETDELLEFMNIWIIVVHLSGYKLLYSTSG